MKYPRKGEPTNLYFGTREYDKATCEIARELLTDRGFMVTDVECGKDHVIQTNAARATALWAKQMARVEHEQRVKAVGQWTDAREKV